MKKILMLTTGGTIASLPSSEGLAPSGSDTILSRISPSLELYDVTTKEILTLDSTNIQPEEWKIIANAIYADINNYDGIVVTHGTDTMGYTSSMMSFMLLNVPIPVVFTGSQVPITSPLSDAPLNLSCALEMAASGVAGVFVAFDRKIILGCRAVKVRTSAFDAFESVNYPYAAVVNSAGLTINHAVIKAPDGPCVPAGNIDADVYLLKLTPGTNPRIMDMMIDSGCHGIVIEAFGAGGLQFVRRDFMSRIEKAVEAEIPVVVCSQCLYERSDFSIYQVGQKALAKGAIQGFDMTREAAVTKLMWALGKTRSVAEISKMFLTSFAGEVMV